MVAVSCGCLAYTPLRLEINLLALLYAASTEGEYLWPSGFLEGCRIAFTKYARWRYNKSGNSDQPSHQII